MKRGTKPIAPEFRYPGIIKQIKLYTDPVVANRYGISREMVRLIRNQLNLPDSRALHKSGNASKHHSKVWDMHDTQVIACLKSSRSMSDFASKLGVSQQTAKARLLQVKDQSKVAVIVDGIYSTTERLKSRPIYKYLGVMSDKDVAHKFNLRHSYVAALRRSIGIAPYGREEFNGTDPELKYPGIKEYMMTHMNREIAIKYNISLRTVRKLRAILDISSYQSRQNIAVQLLNMHGEA